MSKTILLFVVLTVGFGVYVGSKAADTVERAQSARAEMMANI